MRGVSEVLSVVIIIFIIIGIASGAYYTLTTYISILTQKAIILGDSFCSDVPVIEIHNTGTSPIDISAVRMQTEDYMADADTAGLWHMNENDGNEILDASANGNIGALYGDTAGLWHFDEGTGMVANDETSYANTGTLLNGALWKPRSECISRACIGFEGSDDHIASNLGFNIGKGYTISAWFNANEISPGWQGIITNADGNHGIWLFGKNIDYYVDGSSLSSTNISLNTWYHAAISYDGVAGTGWLYINGQLDPNFPQPLAYFPINSIFIGNSFWDEYFNGTIDEVAVYNRTLSAGEIQELYELQRPAFIEWGRGKLGQSAIELDGIDDYAEIQDSNSLDILAGQGFTIEAWIKTGSADGIIFERFGSSNVPYYRLSTSDPADGKVRLAIRDTNNIEVKVASTTNINDDKWHHVIGVRDTVADMLFIYVDGVQENSAQDTTTGNLAVDGRSYIGSHQLTMRQSFKGIIDEVRILDRALTGEEIISQQGWNYVCPVIGQTAACRELNITKTAGDIDAYFNKAVLGQGESIRVIDNGCKINDGLCEYRVQTASKVLKTSVYC